MFYAELVSSEHNTILVVSGATVRHVIVLNQ